MGNCLGVYVYWICFRVGILFYRLVATMTELNERLAKQEKVLKKIRAWLENQAIRDEKEAKKAIQFPSLKEAYIAEAKNLRAVIKEINDALSGSN